MGYANLKAMNETYQKFFRHTIDDIIVNYRVWEFYDLMLKSYSAQDTERAMMFSKNYYISIISGRNLV